MYVEWFCSHNKDWLCEACIRVLAETLPSGAAKKKLSFSGSDRNTQISWEQVVCNDAEFQMLYDIF